MRITKHQTTNRNKKKSHTKSFSCRLTFFSGNFFFDARTESSTTSTMVAQQPNSLQSIMQPYSNSVSAEKSTMESSIQESVLALHTTTNNENHNMDDDSYIILAKKVFVLMKQFKNVFENEDKSEAIEKAVRQALEHQIKPLLQSVNKQEQQSKDLLQLQKKIESIPSEVESVAKNELSKMSQEMNLIGKDVRQLERTTGKDYPTLTKQLEKTNSKLTQLEEDFSKQFASIKEQISDLSKLQKITNQTVEVLKSSINKEISASIRQIIQESNIQNNKIIEDLIKSKVANTLEKAQTVTPNTTTTKPKYFKIG